MASELIINARPYETRVALVENGLVAELHIERDEGQELMGNIYRGKVARVLPGMQAAFIDIGLDRSAFLYVSDVYKDFSDIEKLMLESSAGDQNVKDVDDGSGTYHQGGHAFHIEELLSEGQSIMVQVAKEPL